MTPDELKARGAFYAALAEVQGSLPRDATLADAMAAANRHGFAWWSQQAGVTLGHSAGHEVSAESLELLLGPYDPPLVSLPEVDWETEWHHDRPPTRAQALIILDDCNLDAAHENAIRRALEALPE